jgi:hypothetical protein
MAYPSVNKVLVKILNSTNVLANSSSISNPLATLLGKVQFMKASAAVYFQLAGAKIASVKIVKSARELVQTTKIGWTAGADLEYGFYISQDVPNKASATSNQVVYVGVSFAGTPTNAQIGAALVAQIEAFAAVGKLKVSATYSSGASFPLVADAGYPLFTVSAPLNVTQANGMAIIPEDTTDGDQVLDTLILTSLAGTTTVTATLAGHGLLPGDVVSISGVTTFAFHDSRTGAVSVGAVDNVVIATVPSSSTFTLQGIAGNGGSSAGTISCWVKNKVRVETASAHGLVVGDKVDLSWTAATTFTINGSGAARTLAGLRVQSVASNVRFWVDGVGSGSDGTNGTVNDSDVIITRAASEAVGIGANLITLGVEDTFAATPVPALDAVTAASYYTEVIIDYVSAKGVNGLSVPALGEQAETVKLYVEESATDYNSAIFRIGQVAQRVGWNSYYPDPSL